MRRALPAGRRREAGRANRLTPRRMQAASERHWCPAKQYPMVSLLATRFPNTPFLICGNKCFRIEVKMPF